MKVFSPKPEAGEAKRDMAIADLIASAGAQIEGFKSAMADVTASLTASDRGASNIKNSR